MIPKVRKNTANDYDVDDDKTINEKKYRRKILCKYMDDLTSRYPEEINIKVGKPIIGEPEIICRILSYMSH